MIYIHVPFCRSFCIYCGFYSELCPNAAAHSAIVSSGASSEETSCKISSPSRLPESAMEASVEETSRGVSFTSRSGRSDIEASVERTSCLPHEAVPSRSPEAAIEAYVEGTSCGVSFTSRSCRSDIEASVEEASHLPHEAVPSRSNESAIEASVEGTSRGVSFTSRSGRSDIEASVKETSCLSHEVVPSRSPEAAIEAYVEAVLAEIELRKDEIQAHAARWQPDGCGAPTGGLRPEACSGTDFRTRFVTRYGTGATSPDMECFGGGTPSLLRQEPCFNGAVASPDTVYFGGGTPSLLPADGVRRIMTALSSLGITGADECTFEVNPDDIVRGGVGYVRALLEAGVSRVSMGVQSLDDGILRWMGRRHDAASARAAFGILRAAGVRNISVDLIFGLPQLSEKQLLSTIDGVLSLGPEHISAYQLSVEEDSTLAQMLADGRFVEASDEQCRRQYDLLCGRLRDAGYNHYEISNWARPGAEAVHNSAYWRRVPYIGLGPGAHSFSVGAASSVSAVPSAAAPSAAAPSAAVPSAAAPSDVVLSAAAPSDAVLSAAAPSDAVLSAAAPSDAVLSAAAPSDAVLSAGTPSATAPASCATAPASCATAPDHPEAFSVPSAIASSPSAIASVPSAIASSPSAIASGHSGSSIVHGPGASSIAPGSDSFAIASGPSAIASGYRLEKRSWNTQRIVGYTAESEVLTQKEAVEESIMLALRTSFGMEERELRGYFKSGRNIPPEGIGDGTQDVISELLSEGALIRDRGRIRIPEDHFFVSDDIILRLVESLDQ